MKIHEALKATYTRGHSEGFNKGTWAGGAEVLDWVEEELKDLKDVPAAARQMLRRHPAFGYKAEDSP